MGQHGSKVFISKAFTVYMSPQKAGVWLGAAQCSSVSLTNSGQPHAEQVQGSQQTGELESLIPICLHSP